MILYFSGTGNSKYVAKRIADALGDALVNLNDRIKASDTSSVETGERVIIVTPTYAWRIPRVVRDCLGLCTTSLSEDKLLELCGEVAQNGYRIEQHALIDYMDYWGGIIPSSANYFYCVYDLNRASDVLYRLIYEDLYTSGYADWPTVPER